MVHTLEVLQMGEQYDVIPQPSGDTYRAAEVVLDVDMDEVLDDRVILVDGLLTLNVNDDQRFEIDESDTGDSLTVAVTDA